MLVRALRTVLSAWLIFLNDITLSSPDFLGVEAPERTEGGTGFVRGGTGGTGWPWMC